MAPKSGAVQWPHDKWEELYAPRVPPVASSGASAGSAAQFDVLQGSWINVVTGELVGHIEGPVLVWHHSFHANPSVLHAADGGIVMNLERDTHRAVLEDDSPRVRLHWDDGEIWYRVRTAAPTGAVASPAAPKAAIPKGSVAVVLSRKRTRAELFERAEALAEASSDSATEEVSSEEFRRNSEPPLLALEDVQEERAAAFIGPLWPPPGVFDLVAEARAEARARSDSLVRRGIAIIPGTDRAAYEEERIRANAHAS